MTTDRRDEKHWLWNGEPVTWYEFCERLTGLDPRKGDIELGDDGCYHYKTPPAAIEPACMECGGAGYADNGGPCRACHIEPGGGG